ncbi:MAG: 6-phosphofructokinase [Gemmataceae bacterium]|nr:6-phosphofructokinase [Gemmataceae bacterium]
MYLPKRLALLVGGGPAPGINGVISAVTQEALNDGIKVFGCYDGFKHLVEGKTDMIKELTKNDVRYIDTRGGSVLRTARTNPTKEEKHMENVLGVFQKLQIDALVTIGGDDTAYSASQVYKRCQGRMRVAHVPKTIDNDLPLPGSTPTFGFESAREHGTYIVRNLAEDARTTARWYLIVSMGRAAGHLALGIGKAAAATLTIIPEEFRGRQITMDEICDIILGAIIKRAAEGNHYGVVVLAEGLIGAIGEEALVAALESGALGRYGKVHRDPHGHLRLGDIDFGRMIKDATLERLEPLALRTSFIDKDLGYELRSAAPIPFDAEYTRDLGYGAVKFIQSDKAAQFGAIISFSQGHMEPLPFDKLIDPATKRMKNRAVDVSGEGYECARRYMTRLEQSDFENPGQLDVLAAKANMTTEQFKSRFEYLVAANGAR